MTNRAETPPAAPSSQVPAVVGASPRTRAHADPGPDARGDRSLPGDRPSPEDLAERTLRRQRLQDSAVALALLGAVLLCSPLLDAVALAGLAAGIPVAVIYVFAVWLVLVILAFWLARRLTRLEG